MITSADEDYMKFHSETYRPFIISLGQALREAREASELRIEEAAPRLHSTPEIVEMVEAGGENAEVSFSLLLLAAKLYDVPLVMLIARANFTPSP